MSKNVNQMNAVELRSALAAGEITMEQVLARMEHLLGQETTNVSWEGPIAAETMGDAYILKSWYGGVRQVGNQLVVCELNHPEAILGTEFGLIYNYGFVRRNLQLGLQPLSEFKIRDFENPDENGRAGLKQKNLDWVHGSYILKVPVTIGGVVVRTEVYYGIIGDQANSTGRTFNCLPGREVVVDREKHTNLIEGLAAQVWGFSSLRVGGDVETMNEVVKRIGRINKFGVSTGTTSSNGRALFQDGKLVDASTLVLPSTTRRSGTPNATITSGTRGAPNAREIAREVAEKQRAARAAAQN